MEGNIYNLECLYLQLVGVPHTGSWYVLPRQVWIVGGEGVQGTPPQPGLDGGGTWVPTTTITGLGTPPWPGMDHWRVPPHYHNDWMG